MNNYKELKVWQKSVELAVKVYQITNEFPEEEVYGLNPRSEGAQSRLHPTLQKALAEYKKRFQ